jgi:dipeptidase D
MDSTMFADLEPAAVLQFFYEISQIPRESGNEAGVRDYLIDFAKKRDLSYIQDKTGNIIIRKPATSGFEHVPYTAIQGHMDMVCVKEEGYEHDFGKDPIKLKIEGDFLKAVGTTLGADNGIALAMILAIFDDPESVHGPLEGIFTVSEETGLDGAFGLEIENMKSRRLINLDSEEEGYFYIGCAGGGEVAAELQSETEMIPKDSAAFTITISGLLGGHSGAEIHTGRGNAVTAAARYVKKLSRSTQLRIMSINGGTKRNVIPSLCTCSFIIERNKEAYARELASQLDRDLKVELGSADPNVSVSLSPAQLPEKAVSLSQSEAVIDALYLVPNGVEAMSKTIEGLVETSNNMAIARLDEQGIFHFTASQRSSILSARAEMEERTCTAFEVCGAGTRRENKYPAWTPNPDSAFAKLCAQSYKGFSGKEPVISAIHGGLECGVINSKAEDMDSISFGPDLEGVHSPDEKMSISSVNRIYQFVRVLLQDLAKQA